MLTTLYDDYVTYSTRGYAAVALFWNGEHSRLLSEAKLQWHQPRQHFLGRLRCRLFGHPEITPWSERAWMVHCWRCGAPTVVPPVRGWRLLGRVLVWLDGPWP